jgi:hypothetical protein
MADQKKNLGRRVELDFSALDQEATSPPWSVPPLELDGDTRAAPLDDNTTRVKAAPPPVPVEEPLRTAFSTRAVLIADLLRDTFSRRFFGRSPYRVLRVDEPEGPSTAGGRLARQSISLVAREGSAPSVVCGWVDASKEEAQLRGYESVARRYESHHGMELDLGPEHYERFLEDLVQALMSGGIKVRVLVLDEETLALVQGAQPGSPSPKARGRRGPGRRMWVLTFILGLLVGRMVPWAAVDAALSRIADSVRATLAGRADR